MDAKDFTLSELSEPLAFEDYESSLIRQLGSEALAKACMDPFDYALKLRTGEVIEFVEARIVGEGWVRITLKDNGDGLHNRHSKLPYPAPRGVDVRVSDIVWVMDAPIGS